MGSQLPTDHEKTVGRLALARIRLQRMGPPLLDLTEADVRRRAELERAIADLEAELATQLSLPGLADAPDVDAGHAVEQPALLTVDAMEAHLRGEDRLPA